MISESKTLILINGTNQLRTKMTRWRRNVLQRGIGVVSLPFIIRNEKNLEASHIRGGKTTNGCFTTPTVVVPLKKITM